MFVIGDNDACHHKPIQGVVIVARSWDVSNDVGEDLFDAEVVVAEGVATVEALECFLGTMIDPAPVGLAAN